MIMAGSHLKHNNNVLEHPGPNTVEKRTSLMSVVSSGSSSVAGRIMVVSFLSSMSIIQSLTTTQSSPWP